MQEKVLIGTFFILSVFFFGDAEPPPQYGPPGFTPGNPIGEYGGGGGGGGGGCNNMDLNRNKQFVMSFYQDILGDRKLDLMEKYLSQQYINHNPNVMDGIASFREALQGPLGQGPTMRIDFKRVSAEGDLVWTHTRLPLQGLGATFAAVDIFRIGCDGLIEEHWDVLQDINVQSRNPHPFF